MSVADGSLAAMSEYDERSDPVSDSDAEDSDAPVADAVWEAPATGVPAVDDVLVAVRALDSQPVEEHVAVFEQAHDRLRRALDPGHG